MLRFGSSSGEMRDHRAPGPRRRFVFPRQSPIRRNRLRAMQPTRTSLIRRVRDSNDQWAWQEFYHLYQPLVISYVRKKGASESLAEDVVSEVFAKLVKTMPTFELNHEKGRFRTWLWRVTMSTFIDIVRREPSRQQALPLEIDVAREDAEEDQAWVQGYRERILEEVHRRLKEETAEKSWYCYEQFILKGRKGKEIATEIGLTSNAVCVNANRVFAKVREQCMAEYEEDLSHA
jgi:RNA polymerase sigma factor (sigma-70 family)